MPATAERPDAPWLALQHDIDLSLERAVDMAALEALAGFRAAYYVQVGCPFYDVASHAGRRCVRRIHDLKHEIGLHFDWRRYEHAGITLQGGLQQDLDILSAILGHRVTTVCAHTPTRNGNPDCGDILTPQIAGETYISDSARGFSDAALAILEAPPERLRINTHPAWWQDRDRRKIIDTAAMEAMRRVQDELEDWRDVNQHQHAVEQDRREGN